MRYHEFLSDARKRPDLNPKLSPNETIQQYLDATQDVVVERPNLFVSFTKQPKLGINPKSRYNTPIGIYAYPADYVMENAGKQGKMATSVPFAGDQPWINIFKARGNIIDIAKITDDEVGSYSKKLADIMEPYEVDVLNSSERYVNYYTMQSYTWAKFADSPGGRFWYVTMKCADIISNSRRTKLPVAWNWLFRNIGIDGIIDSEIGIIHENEPVQAVFFSLNSVDLIDRIPNRGSPEERSSRQAQGLTRKEWFEKSIAQFKNLLRSGKLEDIVSWLDLGDNNLLLSYAPKEISYKVLEKRPFYLLRLKNPSPDEIFIAASRNPLLITQIDQKHLKALSRTDIVNILRAYNTARDADDPRRARAPHAKMLRPLAELVAQPDKNFIVEVLRINPYVWAFLYDWYGILNLPENFYDIVYQVAKQQGNKLVMQEVEEAGYEPA